MIDVITATEAKRQHGNRAMTVLRRTYIWHKQKAAAAKRDNDEATARRHFAMMSDLDSAQQDLKALG